MDVKHAMKVIERFYWYVKVRLTQLSVETYIEITWQKAWLSSSTSADINEPLCFFLYSAMFSAVSMQAKCCVDNSWECDTADSRHEIFDEAWYPCQLECLCANNYQLVLGQQQESCTSAKSYSNWKKKPISLERRKQIGSMARRLAHGNTGTAISTNNTSWRNRHALKEKPSFCKACAKEKCTGYPILPSRACDQQKDLN